jgi:hypothetical protein
MTERVPRIATHTPGTIPVRLESRMRGIDSRQVAGSVDSLRSRR